MVRDGNVVLARTELGRSERVVIAGHLDTVPIAGNVPSWTTRDSADHEIIWGRGACDMKGGVAVQLSVAAALIRPRRDVTWVFYDNEEVEEYRNGLARIAREHPDYLRCALAVLCEPTNARIEGGCQGSMQLRLELRGVAAHSARSWMGQNAIHDAGGVLQLLASYQPQQIEVDGLIYREGLNAVMINGGIAGNVIPDRCVVEVNYRFAPDKSPAEAEAYVRRSLTATPCESPTWLLVPDLASTSRLRQSSSAPSAVRRAPSLVGLMWHALALWAFQRSTSDQGPAEGPCRRRVLPGRGRRGLPRCPDSLAELGLRARPPVVRGERTATRSTTDQRLRERQRE